jgi:hypothetical protein
MQNRFLPSDFKQTNASHQPGSVFSMATGTDYLSTTARLAISYASIRYITWLITERCSPKMFRVLDQRGRAVFVEPGAKHSSSKETREFVQKYKKVDPTWLEKDVILDEILALAKEVGFQDAKTVPHLLPNMKSYGMEEWIHFAKGQKVGGALGIDYLGHLANLNYNGRIIFYLQK